MANSRLEKIGTIYTRARGLLESGALAFNDRPLWYDVYERFPPKDHPQFKCTTSKLPIKNIFYEEDKIRVQLDRYRKGYGITNLMETRTPSFTNRFLKIYQSVEIQYGKGECHAEALITEAMDRMNQTHQQSPSPGQLQVNKQSEDIGLGTQVNLKDIFRG